MKNLLRKPTRLLENAALGAGAHAPLLNAPAQTNDMKTRLRLQLATSLTICAALGAMAETVRGQIYVANFANGTIGEYDATTGATINPALVSGLNYPYGVAVSGGDIYVANNAGTIGEYDATTGATINPALVSGLDQPHGLAFSGGNIYVANYGGTIGEYTTSGATVNATLATSYQTSGFVVSGGNMYAANWPWGTVSEYTTSGTPVDLLYPPLLQNGISGIAVSGGDIYYADYYYGTIREMTTSGENINSFLISGLNDPYDIAVSGGNIYVSNIGNGTIGEYDATTGATINPALVSGLDQPYYFDVESSSAAPEPAAYGVLAGVGLLAVSLGNQFRRKQA